MRRRKFLVSGASAIAGAKHADVALREYDGAELESAIAERIGDSRHRWVDIEFPYRGECEPYYQITDVHHNLTRLDEEALSVVDAITGEWNLELVEEAATGNGLHYRTLTHHSESPREHRRLAETVLRRVYGVDPARIADISQADGTPEAESDDPAEASNERPPDRDDDSDEDGGRTVHKTTMKKADWLYHERYRDWLRECYGLLAEEGSATGVDFLDVTDLPGFTPLLLVDDSEGGYSSFRGLSEEERQEQREQALHDPRMKIERRQNEWLETRIFAGLRVLAEEGNEHIRPPRSNSSPREQEWRYTGSGNSVDPTLENSFDIVIDTVFDYE